jgi:hypothetical protein
MKKLRKKEQLGTNISFQSNAASVVSVHIFPLRLLFGLTSASVCIFQRYAYYYEDRT